jgi:hypothetical protein
MEERLLEELGDLPLKNRRNRKQDDSQFRADPPAEGRSAGDDDKTL